MGTTSKYTSTQIGGAEGEQRVGLQDDSCRNITLEDRNHRAKKLKEDLEIFYALNKERIIFLENTNKELREKLEAMEQTVCNLQGEKRRLECSLPTSKTKLDIISLKNLAFKNHHFCMNLNPGFQVELAELIEKRPEQFKKLKQLLVEFKQCKSNDSALIISSHPTSSTLTSDAQRRSSRTNITSTISDGTATLTSEADAPENGNVSVTSALSYGSNVIPIPSQEDETITTRAEFLETRCNSSDIQRNSVMPPPEALNTLKGNGGTAELSCQLIELTENLVQLSASYGELDSRTKQLATYKHQNAELLKKLDTNQRVIKTVQNKKWTLKIENTQLKRINKALETQIRSLETELNETCKSLQALREVTSQKAECSPFIFQKSSKTSQNVCESQVSVPANCVNCTRSGCLNTGKDRPSDMNYEQKAEDSTIAKLKAQLRCAEQHINCLQTKLNGKNEETLRLRRMNEALLECQQCMQAELKSVKKLALTECCHCPVCNCSDVGDH